MKLYTNSLTAWDAMLTAIQTATRSIYIEMYIFSDDTHDTHDTHETHDFVQALCERSQRGVQVILILDAFGSSGLDTRTREILRSDGVEVRFFRHWIHRTHRKTIIIDSSIAFVGGVNITRHASAWHDLQLRVTGPIVARLLKVFTRTYKLSGGTTHLSVRAQYLTRKHRIRSWILEHTPRARQFTLKRYYLARFERATTRLVFVTPYFIPHRWFLGSVRRAVARGISVEILIPEQTDSRILDAINRFYGRRALRLGAHVIMTPGTNHAKAMLIDDREGLVGSGNIDALSFDHNSELGIFFTEPAAVAELRNIIDTWKHSGAPYTDARYRLPWYYAPLITVFRILYSFL